MKVTMIENKTKKIHKGEKKMSIFTRGEIWIETLHQLLWHESETQHPNKRKGKLNENHNYKPTYPTNKCINQ